MQNNDIVPEGYNTAIPAQITTPDRVETRLGTLEFEDGFPTEATAALAFDNLDFLRGVEVFLQCIPAASLEAMRAGLVAAGADAAHKLLIADRLLDSNPLFLTGNTDTVYLAGIFDLERDGPVVVEVPPGCGPGTANDAWFRFIVDMGGPGPDRGEGGKYLILPPGWDGEVPDGHFVSRSRTYTVWLILRGFLVDGRPDAAVAAFRDGVKTYPLDAAGDPPEMEFSSFSGATMNTIHANDFHFYEELASVIHREPLDAVDAETRGLLAAIGIRKDRPFEPDEGLRRTLTEAVATGNATARSIAFHTRDERAYIYPGRHWKTGFVGGDYRWLGGDGLGGRELDSRTMFFYLATVNTPAMALEIPGLGSQYALLEREADGALLSGERDYRLQIPTPVPAKDFWSLVAYDPQTRSELQTGQPFPGLNSQRDELAVEPDGTVEIRFGPEPPEDERLQPNWIQTVPGKGWFLVLRLYGPLEPWFERTWAPGDVEGC